LAEISQKRPIDQSSIGRFWTTIGILTFAVAESSGLAQEHSPALPVDLMANFPADGWHFTL